MALTAEEIFNKIKSDLADEHIEPAMMAARVVANVLLATEAAVHIEQCLKGPLDPLHMCFVRGVEIGFILGHSTAIGGNAESKFGSEAVNVDLIFADLRKRMAEAKTQPTNTIEVPPSRLILPS